MRKTVLASHGAFAEGAYDSVSMIIGAQENVRTYHMHPGENASDFAEMLRKEITSEPETEFVILTDLFGASVCSAMTELSVYSNVKVFSGMNLCMILEILSGYPEKLSNQDVEDILTTAREGVKCIAMEQIEEEDF